jgi:hypothetical protein
MAVMQNENSGTGGIMRPPDAKKLQVHRKAYLGKMGESTEHETAGLRLGSSATQARTQQSSLASMPELLAKFTPRTCPLQHCSVTLLQCYKAVAPCNAAPKNTETAPTSAVCNQYLCINLRWISVAVSASSQRTLPDPVLRAEGWASCRGKSTVQLGAVASCKVGLAAQRQHGSSVTDGGQPPGRLGS